MTMINLRTILENKQNLERKLESYLHEEEINMKILINASDFQDTTIFVEDLAGQHRAAFHWKEELEGVGKFSWNDKSVVYVPYSFQETPFDSDKSGAFFGKNKVLTIGRLYAFDSKIFPRVRFVVNRQREINKKTRELAKKLNYI